MNAKKCDRCGEFYDHYDGAVMEHREKDFYVNTLRLCTCLAGGRFMDECIQFDLCHDCMSMMLDFLFESKKAGVK